MIRYADSPVTPDRPRGVAGVRELSTRKVPSSRANESVPWFTSIIQPAFCASILDPHTMLLAPKERYFGYKGGWLVFWITVACATDMTLFGYDQVSKA
jgi:hypothetical protein